MKVHPEDLDFLDGLFERYVDPGLAFLRKQCTEPLRTVNINLVAALTSLLQVVPSCTAIKSLQLKSVAANPHPSQEQRTCVKRHHSPPDCRVVPCNLRLYLWL